MMQVNVADAVTAAAVKSWDIAMKSNPAFIAKVNVVVTGVPRHSVGDTSPAKGQIANSVIKSFGSLSCVLEHTTTGEKHLLSCWHVMKGNLDYSHDDDNTKIIDSSSAIVAERWCGGIAGAFDYGIAQCTVDNSNAFLKTALNIPAETKLTFRPVLSDDVDGQVEVKFFDCLNQKISSGIIYAACDSVAINYQDKTRNVLNVLVLCNTNGTAAISAAGNSGAMIFDSSNRALGIIIGGDKFYSYAIRISNIFRIHTDLTIGK
jgi:hypothetical protein